MFYSRLGVVASESFYASRIGASILELGGNAVDAGVATSLALTYLLPHLNGVGGDFLALVYNGDKVMSILGLGWAPEKISSKPPRIEGQS
jgi:gamma-glutamyltranspeptidase/glutathione hydrolase